MSAATAPESNGSALEVVRPTPLPTPIKGPRLGLPTESELNALMQYGSVIVKSGLAPKHIATPEAAIVVMRYGHQLGIDEFTALQNMYVIGGKPTSMASLLHSLILRDHGGGAIQIKEMSAQRCVLLCKRADAREATEISYTFEEAKAANLTGKDIWKQYPADMLFARAISRAGRAIFRDSTMGMYTPEELGGSVVEVQGEIIDAGAGEVPRDEQPRASNRLARLHALGGERGLDHEALHQIAMLKLGHALGAPDLTDTMLRDFETLIETAADEELALWATDWAQAIRAAEREGREAVIAVGERIKAAGITQRSHPGLAQEFKAAVERLKNEPVETRVTTLPGMPSDHSHLGK